MSVSFCPTAAVSKMKTKYNKEDANHITRHLEKPKLFYTAVFMAALNLKPIMALINIGGENDISLSILMGKNDILLSGCFTYFQTLKGEEKEEYR